MANLLLDTTIKNKLNELLGSTPSDLFLNIIWSKITGLIGYEIDSKEYVDEKNGRDSNRLYLDRCPVTSLTEVVIDDQIEDLNDFEIYEQKALTYKEGVLVGSGQKAVSFMACYADNVVKVTYDAGYVAETFPDSLVFAVALWYNHLTNQNSSKQGLKSYKIADISYTFKTDEEIMSSIYTSFEDIFI